MSAKLHKIDELFKLLDKKMSWQAIWWTYNLSMWETLVKESIELINEWSKDESYYMGFDVFIEAHSYFRGNVC